MEEQFGQPQRQSSVGVLIMFMNTLQKWLRALGPIVLIYFIRFKDLDKAYLILGVFVFLVLIVVVAFLKYKNFTFYLDSDNKEFVIQEGILNKTKTIIQLDKIQQVNINQSFIQRLINVYEINVDTAGSAEKEGQIKAITHLLALALKARLLEKENNEVVENEGIFNVETIQEKTAEESFIKISFLSLLKVGITSNYVKTFSLILAFFITIYENTKNILSESDFEVQNQNIDSFFEQSTFIIPIVLVMLCLILIINLIRVIFKYFDYKIVKQNGSLLLSFGLLSTKSTIIKSDKVQLVTITSNYFQKKMDILELKIKQATSGEKQEKKALIEIPGCNKEEKDAILALLYNTIPEKGLALKPNYRKLVFSIFLSIVLPFSGYMVFAYYIEPQFFQYFIGAVCYVLFVGTILVFGFRNNRLFITNDFIIKQSGAWDIDNTIVETGKIQAITTSQLFWHKRANIGSVTIHTAGGNLSFQLGNFSTIKDYVNLWLYKIEVSNSNWM
ncbi:putative membrane protein [Flavobacterium sp. 7E]|uniref:PH domain-containing protein n=1 Tax=Flavobacterium sp. 7E TaxID=2735898 RepID=UPI00157013B3|nr:PH domain-containing protein [Flavobacterium sp. 7E]NRS90241.1 putative membrane protein [Flavobacterium sp. 7E]